MKVISKAVSNFIYGIQKRFESIENKDNKPLQYNGAGWSAYYTPGDSIKVVVKDAMLIYAFCNRALPSGNILYMEKSLTSEPIKVTPVSLTAITATFLAIGAAITLAVVAAVKFSRG